MEIRDKSVLVAGAGGGLGSRLARELAEHGALLTLAGRSRGRLEDVGVAGTLVEADLRLPSEAERAVRAAVDAHGRLDGVINAAGVVAFGTAEETSTDTIEELFLTNTFMPIFLIQSALPHLREGGVILNLSGIVAEQPVAGMAGYSASKAALGAFGTALRRELRRRKITVIDARPGHTETGLADHPIAGEAPRFPRGHDPDRVVARLIEAIQGDEADLPPEAFESR